MLIRIPIIKLQLVISKKLDQPSSKEIKSISNNSWKQEPVTFLTSLNASKENQLFPLKLACIFITLL